MSSQGYKDYLRQKIRCTIMGFIIMIIVIFLAVALLLRAALIPLEELVGSEVGALSLLGVAMLILAALIYRMTLSRPIQQLAEITEKIKETTSGIRFYLQILYKLFRREE